MFKNFKHIIEVDKDLFFDCSDPFSWVPNQSAKQFFFPYRPTETTCVWRIEEVIWNPWTRDWHKVSLGGEFKAFVATNSDEDAVMVSLRYAG